MTHNNLIDLNISFDSLNKLEKIDISKFTNGLVIVDIIEGNIFPIIYRYKQLAMSDLFEIFEKLSLHYHHKLKTIQSYNFINNNLLYFKVGHI